MRRSWVCSPCRAASPPTGVCSPSSGRARAMSAYPPTSTTWMDWSCRGESTTMTLGIEREGLGSPLQALAARGVPIFGTCAGLIMLDRDHLAIMDVRCERNAFGRQVHSFEADLPVAGLGEPALRAVFIRAPWIREHGPAVELLAEVDGHPVAAREGELLGVAFHPELSGDTRLHEHFLARVRARRSRQRASTDRL